MGKTKFDGYRSRSFAGQIPATKRGLSWAANTKNQDLILSNLKHKTIASPAQGLEKCLPKFTMH